MSRLHVWWVFSRRCTCGHKSNVHRHYRAGTDCSECPCERFQWRLFKWVY